MNRILTAILLVVPAFGFAACTGDGTGYTKQAARAAGGVDAQGNDICAAEGWYDDGVCDSFCPDADTGDCPVSNQCPDPSDPAVHYLGDPETCQTVKFACTAMQIPFSSQDCGCGCIDVANPGPTCGGLGGATCADGFFCNYAPDAMCGAADQTGTCEPKPDVCPEIYGPVCGCDGQTYENACAANAAGVSVAKGGACGSAGTACGGWTGHTCGAGELCKYAIGDHCGAADASGVCEPIPQACDTLYDPVCGCDGKTYANECEANAAGTSASTSGPCK